MSKIIIHNNASGLDDYKAISMVERVIADGKVSGDINLETDQYCYATTFSPSDPELKYKYVVTCAKRKGKNTYTFKVYREH